MLKEARIAKGLHLMDAAESTEMGTALISDIEAGRRPPTADQCQALAALYRLNFEELITAAQEFHAAFWSAQGRPLEMETKIGHIIPAESEMAILRDEVERLREELSAGISSAESLLAILAGDRDSEMVAIAVAESWIERARAGQARTTRIIG